MTAHVLLLTLFVTFLNICPHVSATVFTQTEIDAIDSFVGGVLKCDSIPGMTVSVVKGEETWARGFGTADREMGVNVTSDTVFAIGSVAKAFTSTLLAIYLNESGYTWTSKVKDILGSEFAFIDEYRTRELTLKDMLTHRTGLSPADFLLVSGFNQSYNYEKFASRIRFLPEVTPFRDVFGYNNWLYTLAGRVVEVLSGKSYEVALQERILTPLGMANTGLLGHNVSTDDNNFAKPYFLIENEIQRLDAVVFDIHPAEPAGSIASSGNDMTRWMKFLLPLMKSDTKDGPAYAEVLSQAFKTHMTTSPFMDPVNLYTPQFPVSDVQTGYGYGWFTATYKGHKKVYHSGSLFTYQTLLTFFPDLDLAIFVSINGPGYEVIPSNDVITYFVSDLLLGDDPWLNSSTLCTYPRPWKEAPKVQFPDPGITNDIINVSDKYVGHFGHPFYGDLEVKDNSGSLTLRFGKIYGWLNTTSSDALFKLDVLEPYRFLSRPANFSVFFDVGFSNFKEDKYQDINIAVVGHVYHVMSFTRDIYFEDDIVATATEKPSNPVQVACSQDFVSSSGLLVCFALIASVVCDRAQVLY